MMQSANAEITVVPAGINLTEFYPSVEWDILEVPASKNEERSADPIQPYYPGKSFEFTF